MFRPRRQYRECRRAAAMPRMRGAAGLPFHHWHRELSFGGSSGGPALCHALQLRVEADAFHAVDVVIAEQRAAPAAEAVERHGNGQWDVDTDHANFDLGGEGAGDLP